MSVNEMGLIDQVLVKAWDAYSQQLDRAFLNLKSSLISQAQAQL